MLTVLILIFAVTYLAIALEHPLNLHKSASALAGAGLMWTIYALLGPDAATVAHQLDDTVTATAQIVFFLMGAMAIVEVIDAHHGFDVLTRRIRTTQQTTLLWLVGSATFVLSAVLDNLTTTIVMISLLRTLLARHEDRLVFAGLVVIAANAGGAWSPIGDVTTTMLWIGGQLSAAAIIRSALLPSLVCTLVPLLVLSLALRGRPVVAPDAPDPATAGPGATEFERRFMFALGIGVLVAVPAFKTLTHLPPFLGILFGLGIVWLAGDLIHRDKSAEYRERLTLAHALGRIDLGSVVFFVGILLAVATLEHTHLLSALAAWLDLRVGREDLIVLLIGMASAVVDNVPMVAGAMGMYPLADYPADHFLWRFLAYCAGTGGSVLIIGSAAGVAAMGMAHIPFGWYLRRISGLALLGYLAGAGVFVLQQGVAA
ncbi:MAG TPA: sodium:proton antiporter NhaD [Rhodocyclaceae bacterium]|nr:sodium:proton antiporter NhaD [Rhodocyclaceae bacterium]HMZ76114.1 sodium:proton antiporter NhaD [Rhodocyclaceae bacterium]HNC80695.1 sodium:proton antiporter NhaD [Rhodocyclaceae bacterium]